VTDIGTHSGLGSAVAEVWGRAVAWVLGTGGLFRPSFAVLIETFRIWTKQLCDGRVTIRGFFRRTASTL
jgi:hypothetical protein